jgi:hypothetical protein
MKKRISLLLTAIFCLVYFYSIFPYIYLGNQIASATSIYLRVIDEETLFYSNANEQSALFFLPYTYYVKSLGQVGEFYHVECYGQNGSPALDGYVKANKLFDDGLSVINPYVSLSLTTVNTAVLYSDTTLVTPIQYVFPERNMRYYGNLEVGGFNVYYVEYNGKLGYVKEVDVYPFAIPNHPNELTFIPKEPEIPPEETPSTTAPKEDYMPFKIIIVACLLFAGLVALFVALKQKPTHQVAAGYYDENDYE